MENTKDNKANGSNEQAHIHTNNLSQKIGKQHNIAKIVGFTVGGIILAIILVCVGITFYLTPDRLKSIINEEGSRYLAADVKVGKIDYTLWSSFPNLRIMADSIAIDTRTLDEVPNDVMMQLPLGSRRFLYIDRISGAVNLWNALKGDITLKNIKVIQPECNIVMVNDSVNNYNIFPKFNKNIRVPHIAVNTVDIGAPVTVKFFYLPSRIDCDAVIRSAGLRFIEGKQDNYTVALSGDLNLTTENVTTLKSIPFNVNTKIAMGFSPLTMTISDLNADVADLKTHSNASLIADNKLTVSKFNLDFSCNDILDVTKYFSFPEENKLNGIKGGFPLFAKLNLATPYEIPDNSITSPRIPAFTLSVNIPEGEVDYPLSGKQLLHLQDLMLQADLNVDPTRPESSVLLIPMARATADGASLDVSATVTELMSGDPMLDADINCVADLAKTYRKFFAGNTLKITGTLNGGSSISCRLSGLKDKSINDLNIKGNFKLKSLKISDAVSQLTANLQNLSLKLRGSVPSMTSAGLGGSRFNLIATSSDGSVKTRADSLALAFSNISLNGKLEANGSLSNPAMKGAINVNAGNFNVKSPGMRFDMQGADVSLTASRRHTIWSVKSDYSTAPTSADDSIITHRVRHTPIYLVATLPSTLLRGLGMLDLNADVKARSGVLIADGYPVRNEFSNLDLSTNLDTITIRSVGLATRGADAQLSGKVYGLRGFLLSASPYPLMLDLDARLSDVNINELSNNYYMGQARLSGKPASYKVAPLGDYTASDSLCVLIPRNLYANLRLHSDRAEYMGWQFSPLSTEITLHDGIAKIGDLSIGSGFGMVKVDWTYSTADLQDIFMQLNADITDFNVESFFKTFPMVISSSPELGNLSGTLSAKAEGKFLMFPDMFINAPSMVADLNLHTNDVEFKREGNLRRITNLMLIKGDTPLKINDLDIHGTFHDNLLQLDPFMIDCGPYKLGIAGVNNLQGEMYYHLGIHGSPLHIPFGVNFVGNWHHPSIRFGGANIHNGREREIASNLKDDVNVNIMRELKHGWLLFVENAAKYDAENNHDYVFNVE